MRIDELQLIAFGPFTDTILDLSEGHEGFHLIYGPNEAGKSSALRALRHLLYGIPSRSTDNFLHPYPKLRIGATLRTGNGDVLKFIRRKGRSNTLRGPDDETMLEETLLQRFVSGIDPDLFATMFGIGYDDLVRGGQDIIQGGGDVGRLVFSAGSGIANLMEIQNELQAEADYLFRPSGQKQKINEALTQLNQSRLELKSAQLKGQDWYGHDKTLRRALERKQTVQSELNTHRKKLNRLQRIQQALPLIAERKGLENDLKQYADAVLLPEDFSEKRRELLSRLATAETQKDQSLKNIESFNKAISELSISRELLDNGDVVEDIHLELGSQNKAVKDRVQLETRRSALLTEAGEILKNLDDDLSLEEAEKRRIKKTEALKIRKLGAEYERIITRMEDARKRLPEITLEIGEIEKELGFLPRPRSLDSLRQAMTDAEDYGSQERHNRSEQADINSALKTIEIEQNKLGLKEKSFYEIEGLALPLPETIRIFEERFDATNLLLNNIKSDSRKVQSALLEVERQIEANRLEQEVPTEKDLLKARELRDMGWGLIAK
ncbi:MAG: AAA family ATPase, partial [Desulfobacterales bacterium]|nr:AAA family ATPase [Desulfobacterales bacterium]